MKLLYNRKSNSLNCQWTYSSHKKTVFNILFVDSLRVCASCDGSVHVNYFFFLFFLIPNAIEKSNTSPSSWNRFGIHLLEKS